ncbi:uncharacterized protein FPRN_02247 [Fusarium proliferatum]|nr:uncharacterized protein FPRN_02247 [Fusarium proliferatum]
MPSLREHTDPRALNWDNRERDSLVNAVAVGVMPVNLPKPSNTELAFSEKTPLLFAASSLNRRMVFHEEFQAGALHQGLEEAAEMDANNITRPGRQSWIAVETASIALAAEDMYYKKLMT